MEPVYLRPVLTDWKTGRVGKLEIGLLPAGITLCHLALIGAGDKITLRNKNRYFDCLFYRSTFCVVLRSL